MEIFTPQNLKILSQLFLAVFLAGIIGFERQRAQKAAGIRTYGLVSLGACMLTIMSISGFDKFIDSTSYDPTRIISNIIVSVGFIGAGLIFHHGIKIEGLTTATGIWVAATIGIAVGLEFYFLAASGMALSYLLIGILRKWEYRDE